MAEESCSVPGCSRTDMNARALCNMHYARYRRHGDPTGGNRRASTLEESLAIRTEADGSCRVWTGGKTQNGYGLVRVRGELVVAHRAAYEVVNGPIPAGMVIDHMCHNRACVNPEHLRAVTQKQNLENNAVHNRRNKSGVRGVHRAHGKWIAQVCHNYQRRYIGSFETLDEAEVAVIAARNALFTHNDLDRVT